LGDDNDFDDDYTQLVTPGTHTISDSANKGVRMGGVSMKFVWQGISMLSVVQETLSGIHSPQCDISNLNLVDIFENIFGIPLTRLIVNETNKSFKLCESNMGYAWGVLIYVYEAWHGIDKSKCGCRHKQNISNCY
jgi:hypothetical protein